ncbi:cupin domain-containing protein [Burkholderia oklahomensis]|uniref:cupin domain-containing protein n=1 Tax=Burkholderia oklahomensis TaxID=342113 RepID=UPI0026503587|nr:cupin domain-containing protein [Burkholderia oklahomensis]MDN7674873.1 cupin domain-containing protein [Burkholderia oklahomensis]
MLRPVFEAVRLDDVVLQPSPIDPAWILEGNPVARSGQWSCSPDSTTSMWVWDCTAGRFNWHFDCDETIHVIEGEVIVTPEGHAPRTLRAGDAALFHAGSRAEWHVPRYVRKHAILRPHISGPALFVHKVVRKLSGTLR